QRQPFRDVPSRWRDEILAQCSFAADAQIGNAFKRSAGWRGWVWPSPLAWGVLAAIWIICLTIDGADAPHATEPSAFTIRNTPSPNSATALFVFGPSRDFDTLWPGNL